MNLRTLVANPHVPIKPFGVGTAEFVVIVFMFLVILFIMRRLVRLKR